jgi:hypothetical protein
MSELDMDGMDFELPGLNDDPLEVEDFSDAGGSGLEAPGAPESEGSVF